MHRIWLVVAAVGALVATACGGGGGREGSSETLPTTVAPTTTSPTTTAAATTSTVAVSTTAEDVDDLAEAVSLGLWQELGFQLNPDAACVRSSFADLPRSTQVALAELAGREPGSLTGLDGDELLPAVQAYLGCEGERMLGVAVASTLLGFGDPFCAAEAWSGLLSTDAVAASVTAEWGLGDLDPALVDRLVAAALPCQPDEGWWIDEVALDLGAEATTADCVARAYVEQVGVATVARLRLLSVADLAVPATDHAAMDLRGRCGYEWNVSVPSPLGAAVGTCINGFANGEPTGVVDCTQRHDAETLSLHDLTADYPTWPGRRTLIEDIEQRCSADADAVESDFSDLAFAWILPTRTMWEQEARTAICLIGQGSGQSWEEPSGLLPAPPSTAAVTASQEPTTGEGFESLQDDTGQLSMRVPSGWSQRDTAPVDVGADSPVPGIAAAPDLDRFMASYSDPGVLALLYPPGDAAPSPDDVLSEVSPTDCRAQPRNDWSTAAFTGRQQRFDCGGSQLLLVAAVPAGRPDARLVFYGQWGATGDEAAILESLASLVITG